MQDNIKKAVSTNSSTNIFINNIWEILKDTNKQQKWLIWCFGSICLFSIIYFDYASTRKFIADGYGKKLFLIDAGSLIVVCLLARAFMVFGAELVVRIQKTNFFNGFNTLHSFKILLQMSLMLGAWSLSMLVSQNGLEEKRIENVELIEMPSNEKMIQAEEKLAQKEQYYNDLIAKEDAKLEKLLATKSTNLEYVARNASILSATKTKEKYEENKRNDMEYWRKEIAKQEAKFEQASAAALSENKNRQQAATEYTGFMAGIFHFLGLFLTICNKYLTNPETLPTSNVQTGNLSPTEVLEGAVNSESVDNQSLRKELGNLGKLGNSWETWEIPKKEILIFDTIYTNLDNATLNKKFMSLIHLFESAEKANVLTDGEWNRGVCTWNKIDTLLINMSKNYSRCPSGTAKDIYNKVYRKIHPIRSGNLNEVITGETYDLTSKAGV